MTTPNKGILSVTYSVRSYTITDNNSTVISTTLQEQNDRLQKNPSDSTDCKASNKETVKNIDKKIKSAAYPTFTVVNTANVYDPYLKTLNDPLQQCKN